MPKQNKLVFINLSLLVSGILLSACTNAENVDNQTKVSTSSLSSGQVKTTLSKVDKTKWQYNSDDKIYYQIGISYAANPTDSSQQTLSIFVPAAYMTATENGDGTYTAELNTKANVGNYTANTAPIVIPINTPGYSSMSALTEYTSQAKTYTDEGFIYVSAGLRGRDSGAPSGVTDAKAAIRYLRYNVNQIAGDMDRIFVFGMSGGGAQSSIIGASGDSPLYDDYLKQIGAVEGVSDSVSGVMAWCPITNLDTANEAYEWSMGSTRSSLSTEEQTISDGLAEAYSTYINDLKLKDSKGNTLELTKSTEGIYQAGSYYDFVKQTVEESLNTFLANTTFPYDASSSSSGGPGGSGAPGGNPPSGQSGDTSSGSGESKNTSIESVDNIQRSGSSTSLSLTGTYNSIEEYIAALNSQSTWITYDSNSKKATITSMADFVKYMKSATKEMAAFDALDKSQGENELFGYGDGQGVHWDSRLATVVKGTNYEADFKTDLAKTDSLGKSVGERINMYTPLYYLSKYYGGYQTSNVAKNWRIRSGLSQGDTALSTELNLSVALQNYGIKNVDFATVWGQQHTEAEVTGNSTTNFIEWVNQSLK
ncbi:subtype A tannase [Streptococcus oralis]|uniref:BD-FAE-like domain-containing protein n=1 Tax=Streptococcus oralis TaxID=1303 RepID=A0A139NZ36_STROR|nr:subtype A tannase [Streptococcus oralis]KXT80964.1 hypothetical protein SORDD15_00973 [Streptococcus oralis]